VQAVRFVVEHARCESCATRVRSALAPLLAVETITIDEAADAATVVARADLMPSHEAIDAALAEASIGSGHTYRIRPGSLSSASAAS
jgi:heavy-metal-associated domain-containing protein